VCHSGLCAVLLIVRFSPAHFIVRQKPNAQSMREAMRCPSSEPSAFSVARTLFPPLLISSMVKLYTDRGIAWVYVAQPDCHQFSSQTAVIDWPARERSVRAAAHRRLSTSGHVKATFGATNLRSSEWFADGGRHVSHRE
jgi:hypothetical protein